MLAISILRRTRLRQLSPAIRGDLPTIGGQLVNTSERQATARSRCCWRSGSKDKGYRALPSAKHLRSMESAVKLSVTNFNADTAVSTIDCMLLTVADRYRFTLA
jgi:hypothetical protein